MQDTFVSIPPEQQRHVRELSYSEGCQRKPRKFDAVDHWSPPHPGAEQDVAL
jgi:hypothetical protein